MLCNAGIVFSRISVSLCVVCMQGCQIGQRSANCATLGSHRHPNIWLWHPATFFETLATTLSDLHWMFTGIILHPTVS